MAYTIRHTMYMGKRIPSAPSENFVRNLRFLMEKHGDSTYSLGARAKMPQRTVHNIIAREQKVSIDAAEQLAKAYGLNGWQMLLADLPSDLLDSPTIAKLYRDYCAANQEGREYIALTAEREAKHGAKEPPPAKTSR